jgi:hypothetical protein
MKQLPWLTGWLLKLAGGVVPSAFTALTVSLGGVELWKQAAAVRTRRQGMLTRRRGRRGWGTGGVRYR